MLRLSKKVDYGLMALMHLARQDETVASSAREIAERYGMPPGLLAKILQRLSQRGLVDARHGTKGGYTLARPASRITAAEVVEAIDGPLSLTQCVTDQGTCVQFDRCNIKSPLQRLNDAVAAMLGRVTIAEMLDDDAAIPALGGNEPSWTEASPVARLPVLDG